MKASEIRDIRKKIGKTQAEFAVLLGVSKNSVQLWETEKRNPSSSMIFLIKETYKKHTLETSSILSKETMQQFRDAVLLHEEVLRKDPVISEWIRSIESRAKLAVYKKLEDKNKI